MAGPSIDDLLRAADKGQAVGTTQRYFKTEPKGSASPAPTPATPEPLLKPGESEKEMMDRLLGRSKTSMSDIDEPERAGQQYASAGRVTPEVAVSAAPKTDRAATLKAVREKYPMYADMADNDLAIALAAKFPAYADLAVKSSEIPRARIIGPHGEVTTPGPPLHPWVKFTQASREGTPVPIARPTAFGAPEELLTPDKLSTPTELLTNTATSILSPGVGMPARIGLQGAAGAIKSAAKGENPLWGGLLDAATAGATEGALGLASKVKLPGVPSLSDLAEKVTGRKEAFKYATEAPGKALDALRDRLPKGKWLWVPTINEKAKITVDEAVKSLKGLEGLEYQAARKEIINEMNALDIRKGGLPELGRKSRPTYAGQGFDVRTSPERFQPPPGSTLERFAEGVAVPFLESPATRGLADVATTQHDPSSGLPYGAMAGLGLADKAGGLWDIARHWVTR